MRAENEAAEELWHNAAPYRAALDRLVSQAIGKRGTKPADVETAARLSYALLRLSGQRAVPTPP